MANWIIRRVSTNEFRRQESAQSKIQNSFGNFRSFRRFKYEGSIENSLHDREIMRLMENCLIEKLCGFERSKV